MCLLLFFLVLLLHSLPPWAGKQAPLALHGHSGADGHLASPEFGMLENSIVAACSARRSSGKGCRKTRTRLPSASMCWFRGWTAGDAGGRARRQPSIAGRRGERKTTTTWPWWFQFPNFQFSAETHFFELSRHHGRSSRRARFSRGDVRCGPGRRHFGKRSDLSVSAAFALPLFVARTGSRALLWRFCLFLLLAFSSAPFCERPFFHTSRTRNRRSSLRACNPIDGV